MSGEIHTQQLIVDLSCSTGALKYGASGFLYGLGSANIPTVNVLAPLKPRVAAQKPEGGLQHPNGDAFQVAETYHAAGGKEIQVYMQDMYADWPYENRGIADYLDKVEQMTRMIVAHPNRRLFSYVPLNEPDQIWYNKTDKKQDLFADWKKICRAIRAYDAEARIVGLNFAKYDSNVYREFLEFARDNDCLPDVVSWHELDNSFFTDWYARHDDYRRIERELGIAPRELCINEYARKEGDLGVPGKLVQWIVRFENSKVDACLAYWTSAGCLNDLVARDTDNQATGGWWLYKWYASMTGNTVQVTPPAANVEGLQGLACFDPHKNQTRVLFGGSSGSTDVVIEGLDRALHGVGSVHVTVWGIDSTGVAPSPGPRFLFKANNLIRNGRITVTLNTMVDSSAYYMILTPTTIEPILSAADQATYPAVFADVSPGGDTTFVVSAPENDFYNLRIDYLVPQNISSLPTTLRLRLNGTLLHDLILLPPADNALLGQTSLDVFLMAGINRVEFHDNPIAEHARLKVESIKVSVGRGERVGYKAGGPGVTLGGTGVIIKDRSAPGGHYAAGIGNGAENFMQFDAIQVSGHGIYRMVIHYSNAEFRGAHNYNSQIVDRCVDLYVNGEAVQRIYFRNTFDWNVYRSTVVDVELRSGFNTIAFSNEFASAPHIAGIEIAARFQD